MSAAKIQGATPSTQASEPARLASFWFGSDLSWIEQACIKSWLNLGHPFSLYVLSDIKGIPAGVDLHDAREIFSSSPFNLIGSGRHGAGVFSDMFRLHMLAQTDQVWVDLDALGVRPLQVINGYAVGMKEGGGSALNGVLRLPKSSRTLASMLEFVHQRNPVQVWRRPRFQEQVREAMSKTGRPWTVLNLPWGCSGPKPLNHFMRIHDEYKHVRPSSVYYPIDEDRFYLLHRPGTSDTDIEEKNTQSVHVYGKQKQALAIHGGGLPVPGSYLERFCMRQGIDPRDAPILLQSWMDDSYPLCVDPLPEGERYPGPHPKAAAARAAAASKKPMSE